jgi:hypothetical protein
MSTQPQLVLPEQVVVPPVSRRVAWLLVLTLTLCVVGSGTGAFLLYGDTIYYRRWTTVRTWSRPHDDVDVRFEAGPQEFRRRYHWYAAMHRSAQKNIKMKTHNDFTMGMVLVALRPDTPLESYGLSGKGGHAWYLTESVGVRGFPPRKREIVVETKVVRIGIENFSADDGRLVLIDEGGRVSQHTFDTEAQSAAQMQAAVEEFLAKLPAN